MVSIEEALRIVEEQQVEQRVTELGLADTLGYSLAGHVHAPFELPSFDNSMVDGYAVCGLRQTYALVGEVPAGAATDLELQPGEAARVFTGARLPLNTSAVIMQEFMETDGNNLNHYNPLREGQNIRFKGGQFQEGELIFEQGFTVNPAAMGILGSFGFDRLGVFRKPEIALVTTGNELIPPGGELQEGQIFESNSYALAGALAQHGFACRERRQLPDQFEATRDGVGELLETSDVVLISGGISVGEYDFVRRALQENGVEELFYRVFQKPGKPLYFGRKEHRFVFALPGNPASSLTCLFIYVIPFLRKLSGAGDIHLPRLLLPMNHEYENPFDRPTFLKASIENMGATILDGQGSSALWSLAMGNALVFLEEHRKVEPGEGVRCILI